MLIYTFVVFMCVIVSSSLMTALCRSSEDSEGGADRFHTASSSSRAAFTEALALLQEMRTAGIAPTAHTYATLIAIAGSAKVRAEIM